MMIIHRVNFLHLPTKLPIWKAATYPYLFNPWSTKLEFKTIICETSNFWMMTIIAHTYHRYSRTLDQLDHFLHATPILIACHAINFIHYQNMIFCWFLCCRTLDIKMKRINATILSSPSELKILIYHTSLIHVQLCSWAQISLQIHHIYTNKSLRQRPESST
jgi:hypothetical protein